MKKYNLTENGKKKYTLLVPEGRHEVSYDQWKDAYQYLEMAHEAKADFENNLYAEATKKSITSIINLIAALCEGVTFEQLKKISFDKLKNIFIFEFGWLSKEQPKKKFKINGRVFEIPDFSKKTAGDFMDVMDLIAQVNDKKDDAELGLVIAAIYMREGEYEQDIDKINERKEFLKRYAKMDVLFGAGFFFSNSLLNLEKSMLLHLAGQAVKELERLTSCLSGWAIILYLQALQKAEC